MVDSHRGRVSEKSLGEAAALSISLILLFAGISKLRTPTLFREQLADFKLLPYGLTLPLAVILPLTEISLASLLLFPRFRDTAALLSLVLFLGFTCLMILTAARGLHIPCACFGVSRVGQLETVGPHTIVRNLLILITCLAAYSLSPEELSFEVSAVALLTLTAIFLAGEVVRLFTSVAKQGQSVVEGARAALTGRVIESEGGISS